MAESIISESQPYDFNYRFHPIEDNSIKVLNSHQYQLITPAFSDYAFKIRSIYLPPKQEPALHGSEIIFPVGTIFIKSFYYYSAPEQPCFNSNGTLIGTKLDQRLGQKPPRDSKICVIETRLLSKKVDGWEPMVFQRKNGGWTDARYGEFIKIILRDPNTAALQPEFTYRIPDINECQQCHTGGSTFSANLTPIGPKDINRLDFSQPNLPQPLANLNVKTKTHLNKFSQNIATHHIAARQYLDINCAHCHNRFGTASSSATHFSLHEKNLSKLGLCKKPTATGGRELLPPYDITPGHASKSFIVTRLKSLDSRIKMPEISKSTIDDHGIEVISTWINQLEGNCLQNDI